MLLLFGVWMVRCNYNLNLSERAASVAGRAYSNEILGVKSQQEGSRDDGGLDL